MNELTWKWTMISPEMNPTAAHAAMAIRHDTTAGMPVLASNQLTMTSEKASIAPTDRSNAPAVSGTSRARPRMAMTTWSANTSLNVVWVRNVSGIHSANSTMMNPSRYRALTLCRPGQVERRPPPRRSRSSSSSSQAPQLVVPRRAPRRSRGAAAPARCGSSRCRRRRARRRRVRAAARPHVSPAGPARRCRSSTPRRRRPLAAAASTRRWMSAFEPTSTPWVGSSSTSTRGSTRSQRAITTFWALPPDSSVISFSDSGGRTSSSLIHLRGLALLRPAVEPTAAPERRQLGDRHVLAHATHRGAPPASPVRPGRSTARRRSPPRRRRVARAPRRRRPCRRGAGARRAARRPPRGPIR